MGGESWTLMVTGKADDKLDLTELGSLLKRQRQVSRRLMAERTGLGASHIQKIEEGRGTDITVSTLHKLARGYELSPHELLEACVGKTPETTVRWVTSSSDMLPLLERALGRRVVVEAEMSPEALDELGVRLGELVSSSSELGHAHEMTEQLRELMDRMGSLVSVLSSVTLAMREEWGSKAPPALPRAERAEDFVEITRAVGSEQGDDSSAS